MKLVACEPRRRIQSNVGTRFLPGVEVRKALAMIAVARQVKSFDVMYFSAFCELRELYSRFQSDKFAGQRVEVGGSAKSHSERETLESRCYLPPSVKKPKVWRVQ